MSTHLSDWMLSQVREALNEVDGVEVPDELQMARSFCKMRTLLEVLVASTDLERAA
ncbi:hypothetical protein ACFXB3_07065 [Streptomyces sp. NPDC059447]|uniref:hypothetical protein n=1 Tax=Streptomyces sp. NPDC059447 TaxID=3346834 RepID=UPI00369EEE05